MSIEHLDCSRHAMLLGIGSVSVDAPSCVQEPSRDDAGSFRPRAGTQRNISLAACRVKTTIIRDQLDQYARMLLAKFLQQRRYHEVGEGLAGGDAN
jgi:hypothetical protein